MQTSISTGPGRPVVAMWNASWMTRGSWSILVTRYECLVTEEVAPITSDSWKASRPTCVLTTWPVMAIIGTESM